MQQPEREVSPEGSVDLEAQRDVTVEGRTRKG